MTFRSKFKRIFMMTYGILCLSLIVIFGFLYQRSFEQNLIVLQNNLCKEIHILNHLMGKQINPLESISQFLDDRYHAYGTFIILNENQDIICFNRLCQTDPKLHVKGERLLPKNFDLKKVYELPSFSLQRFKDHWVLKAHLKYAPWVAMFHIKAFHLIKMALRDMGPTLFLIFIFASFFLFFARRLILNEFINPAEHLIKHIINQGQKEKGQTEEPFTDVFSPWYTWFAAVSMVFDKNKMLVKKLEDHIDALDQSVLERTQSLFKKNIALQQAVENLKKAQNQIIVQEKLAGLGAITAGIAHEIKNPLNFILNFAVLSRDYLDELKTDIEKKPEYTNFNDILTQLDNNLNKIEIHANRADSIIGSMLLHARGGVDTLQETDITMLLDENSLLVLPLFRQKGMTITVEKLYDPSMPLSMVYKQDLSRVILNLINNGCYAMDVRKKNAEANYKPCLILKTIYRDNKIHIFIRDNGIGIPLNIKEKIFNPFFTTKPAGSGTGLGLSLSYDIITHQHMGSITVESQPNTFTQFHITLPYRPADLK